MAAQAVSVKLSEHRQAGELKCYKRVIGGRLFYLPRDREQAARMALALEAKWHELRRASDGWTDGLVSEVLAPFRPTSVRDVRRKSASLYATMDIYLLEYKAQVSAGRYLRQRGALGAYRAQQADGPLHTITAASLSASVAHFARRPVTSHGAPMAIATVQTIVKAIRAFFDWADGSGRWEAPKRLSRLFRLNYKYLRTPLEVRRDGDGPEVFTLKELKTLWEAGTARQRLYMGLALNTGETAAGLAALTRDDLFQDDNGWSIDRYRTKTGVRGVYPLWNEVRVLLAEQMNTNGDALLLRTMDGRPLVWFHSTGRVDSVAKTWRNLLQRCPTVRPLSFKHLRKTGATMVELLSGSDRVAETYLSHRGSSMAKRHYLQRDYTALADVLGKLQGHLCPVFMKTSS